MYSSYKVSNKKFYNVEFEEHVVSVNRVVKVTKGGRVFSFSVLVVIGNKNGHFGLGLGKALEVNEARRKAINNAKKNLYCIVLDKNKTIPHEVNGKFCSSKIIIRPAKSGVGIIAGGVARVIFEALGIKDIVAKSLGSRNVNNLAMATLNALMELKTERYYNKLKNKRNGGNQILLEDSLDNNNDVND